MTSTDFENITRYIALWNWQLVAIIFFCFSFLMFVLPRNTRTIVFGISFFFIFVLCEYLSLKRKQEFYNAI